MLIMSLTQLCGCKYSASIYLFFYHKCVNASMFVFIDFIIIYSYYLLLFMDKIIIWLILFKKKQQQRIQTLITLLT